MTMPIPKKPLLRGGILVGVGIILIAMACLAPTPTAIAEEAELSPTTAVLSEIPGSEQEAPLPNEPTFTPYTVRPEIKNRVEVARALEENYPPELRSAGIGGTVTVWVYIDMAGAVRDTRIRDSSGHEALDEAALDVAQTIEFTAAEDDGKAVAAWIALPITFTTR
jgi:TonB family protein